MVSRRKVEMSGYIAIGDVLLTRTRELIIITGIKRKRNIITFMLIYPYKKTKFIQGSFSYMEQGIKFIDGLDYGRPIPKELMTWESI